MICEDTGKTGYLSKHSARASLTGQLKSKRVRVYPCPYHPGHYHLTKERNLKIDRRKRARGH